MSTQGASSAGAWLRARIAVAVTLGLLLFAFAAGLTTWLAERPGLRARFDLTKSQRNSLDPVLSDIVDKLPELATIEVFFRPLPKHIAVPGGEAQGRFNDLLEVLGASAPEKIKVIRHGAGDPVSAAEALARLRIDGDEFGLVVVHRGKSRARLTLFTDIADLDVGNPDPNNFVPASIAAFRGEEALAKALKRVSAEARPKIYFLVGHGERNPYGAAASEGNESGDLGALTTTLVADGFEIERFDGNGVAIPSDCAALALVDPTQALSAEECSTIFDYVDRGGRLLLTGSHRYPDGEGSTRALAARYGIDIGLGYVAEQKPGPNGYMVGLAECANIFSGPGALQIRHAVTEPLVRFGRSLWSQMARPLSRQGQRVDVVLTELAQASENSWIDLPDSSGLNDWKPDRTREPMGRRTALVYAAQLTPAEGGAATDETRLGRLIVIGSPELLTSRLSKTNKDFALNAFNWLAAREYRLSVAPRVEEHRILDVRQGDNLVRLRSLVVFLLPGLCLILGLVTWYRRRR